MTHFINFAPHILTLANGNQFFTLCHEHSKWLHGKLAPDQPARSERLVGERFEQALSIHPETGDWRGDYRLGMFSFSEAQ